MKIAIYDPHLMLKIKRVIAIITKIIPKGAWLDSGNNRAKVTACQQPGLAPEGGRSKVLSKRVVRRMRCPSHFGEPHRTPSPIRKLDLGGHLFKFADEAPIIQFCAIRMDRENVERGLEVQHPVDELCIEARR